MINDARLSRENFRKWLIEACDSLGASRGETFLFAAPLANRIRDLARHEIGDFEFELNGFSFGPALFPQLPAEERHTLKFRNFIESFPEVVELFRGQSGDMVRVVDIAPEVEVARPAPLISNEPPEPAVQSSSKTGYILVDSVDIIAQLHALLGAKPTGAQLPNWEQLMVWLDKRFPDVSWTGLYFMAVGAEPRDATAGFADYLRAVRFRVVQLRMQYAGVSMEEGVSQRRRETAIAITKTLEALAKREPMNVFVVSHNAALAAPLKLLVANKSSSVGVVGFPEQMAPEILELGEAGLKVFDLERDSGLFRKALSARQVVVPGCFDPEVFLK